MIRDVAEQLMHQSPRIYLLLLAIVLAGVIVFSVKGHAEQDKRQSELQMTLSTTTMMLCLGSPLPLDLEITNQGNEEVKIDKSELWSRFSYEFSTTDGSGRGGGMASSCGHCRGNYVALKTGGRYEGSFEFPLDADFFKDPGKYTIKMNFDQISTNELSFELYDCNPQ